MSQRNARPIGGIYLPVTDPSNQEILHRGGNPLTGVISTSSSVTTYAATHRHTHEMVGLSVIVIPPTEELDTIPDLLQSCTIRSQVRSPYVRPLNDWGIDGTRIYLVTSLYQGSTLQYLLDHEDISLTRTLDLISQIARAVQALHAQNILGLDLRPQFITIHTNQHGDHMMVDDIGIRPLLQSLHYFSSDRVDDLGSFDTRYLSPEQIHEQSPSATSDIYQLGLLLFLMITGRLPFVGQNTAETALLHTQNAVPQMRQFRHNTSPELQLLVQQMLAKDPQERFASAADLLVAIDTLQTPSRPVEVSSIQTTFRDIDETRDLHIDSKDISLKTTLIQDKKQMGLPTTTIPNAAGIYAYLCYEEPETKEITRLPLLQKQNIVGRMDPKRKVIPTIDLTIFDPRMSISRQHARITYQQSTFYVEDLGSRNKTRLGDLTLTPHQAVPLHHNDTISFGNVRIRFTLPK